MKRRQSLRLLGLLPAWLAACKSQFPSVPTVVTGKVVDEDGMPAMGIELTLSGIKKKGVSPIPTFDERTETDTDGKYTLSYVVTSSTDFVEFNLPPTSKYMSYIDYGSRYQKLSSPLTILPKEYGKTKIVNLQIRKR